MLAGGFILLNTVATGNAPSQFILSTTNLPSIEQQALIQRLLLQNTLVVGCNSLLVTSAGRLNAMPAQTINCVAGPSAIPATVKAESDVNSKNITVNLNAGYSTCEVCTGWSKKAVPVLILC